MNQLPENSLRIYDVTLLTSYLIGLPEHNPRSTCILVTQEKWKYIAFNISFPISSLYISTMK